MLGAKGGILFLHTQSCVLGGADCANAQSVETAKSMLADAPNVTVVPVPINDGWARDWGPSVRQPAFGQHRSTRSRLFDTKEAGQLHAVLKVLGLSKGKRL